MRMGKLKFLVIASCFLVAALWSGGQCMELPEAKNDEKVIDHVRKTVINKVNYPITADFDLGEIGNEKLGYFHSKGSILYIAPYGLFPKVDTENLEKIEKELTQWAISINLLIPGSKYYNKFNGNFASGAAFSAPTFRLDDDRMRAYVYLHGWFFSFDDILDNTEDHKGSYNISPQTISSVIDTFIGIFEGKFRKLNELPSLTFPLYIPLCQALLDVQKLSCKCIDDYENRNYHFVKDISSYLRAVAWEHSEQNSEPLSEGTYLFRRKHTIGAFPSFEYIALMHGITINKEIRKNLLFKRLREAGTIAIFLTNDIFSLRKELNNNETDNLIIFKSMHQKVILEEAFKHANNFVNDEIKDIIKISHKLRENFAKDKSLHTYISLVENFVDGHHSWYEYCHRYGKIEFKIKQIISDLPYNYYGYAQI